MTATYIILGTLGYLLLGNVYASASIKHLKATNGTTVSETVYTILHLIALVLWLPFLIIALSSAILGSIFKRRHTIKKTYDLGRGTKMTIIIKGEYADVAMATIEKGFKYGKEDKN